MPPAFLQIFEGNVNPTDVARALLPKPTLTRYIRIRPMTWEQGICMRFEVYGCRISGNPEDIGDTFQIISLGGGGDDFETSFRKRRKKKTFEKL